mmetsp:Transcript_62750/g.180528  ORF Transcript_62750/g.180528 Transcript_62750/m.180528 type:complete len:228 (-) Transcript_62750:1239-1922(-)
MPSTWLLKPEIACCVEVELADNRPTSRCKRSTAAFCSGSGALDDPDEAPDRVDAAAEAAATEASSAACRIMRSSNSALKARRISWEWPARSARSCSAFDVSSHRKALTVVATNISTSAKLQPWLDVDPAAQADDSAMDSWMWALTSSRTFSMLHVSSALGVGGLVLLVTLAASSSIRFSTRSVDHCNCCMVHGAAASSVSRQASSCSCNSLMRISKPAMDFCASRNS